MAANARSLVDLTNTSRRICEGKLTEPKGGRCPRSTPVLRGQEGQNAAIFRDQDSRAEGNAIFRETAGPLDFASARSTDGGVRIRKRSWQDRGKARHRGLRAVGPAPL